MNKRPKLKIELSQPDRIIEILGWSSLFILWFFILFYYSDLPETIPTHFNGTGKVDNYGNKLTILILPIISTIVFVGLSILNKFPHIFNYPTEITVENALKKYTLATKMIRYLKFMIVLIFSFIVYMTFSSVKGNESTFNPLFLAIIFVLIAIPIGYYSVKMMNKEKS